MSPGPTLVIHVPHAGRHRVVAIITTQPFAVQVAALTPAFIQAAVTFALARYLLDLHRRR